MSEHKCPFCGCESFFVKDADDEYETHEFQVKDGRVHFASVGSQADLPEIRDDDETHCTRCAWHGKLKALKEAD